MLEPTTIDRLYHRCDPEVFYFMSTAELPRLERLADRLIAALRQARLQPRVRSCAGCALELHALAVAKRSGGSILRCTP
jgi:hypothetical protein